MKVPRYKISYKKSVEDKLLRLTVDITYNTEDATEENNLTSLFSVSDLEDVINSITNLCVTSYAEAGDLLGVKKTVRQEFGNTVNLEEVRNRILRSRKGKNYGK